VTITNLTGFNAKFIKDSGIGPGAKIQITRSGDVIPFILGVVQPVTPQMPDDDTAVWTDTGVDLVVADASKNATVAFERLNDFFASVDVPHLGDGNLMKMFEMGFDTPEKIIELTQQDISSLVGSAAIGKKIYAGLRAKLTNIPLYVLMGSHHAFGRGVGVRKMKKLYEAFEGDMSFCADIKEVVAVEGFDVKTATKIAAGYGPFLDFLNAIKPYVTLAKYEAKKVGNLTGKVFVFTGFRSKELEDKIVNAGGTMGSTVSSKTTYLVTAEPNSTSGKAVKARELGVQVIGQQELTEML
jgi:DNA ligase (NAD+)